MKSSKKWLSLLLALCLILSYVPVFPVSAVNTSNSSTTITRADMEEALVEVAWSFYFMGSKYQYDNISLNTRGGLRDNTPLCGDCGGYCRQTLDVSPESASSDQSAYTVCSGYCFDVYKEAFDYSILGNKLNCLTMTLWRATSYPDDMAILRWHSKGKGNLYNAYDTEFSVSYDGCWYDADEVYTFFQNYETTMRPGDIVVFDDPGHAMLYVGNGVILDSNGSKYKMDTGLDALEADGTVDYNTIEGYYLNPNNTNFYVGDLASSTKTNSIVVVRPLNLLTIDDGDNDPGNDVLNSSYELDTGLLKAQLDFDNTSLKTTDFTIEDSAYIRMKYPAMNIDRTVDITHMGTAVKGGQITYTIVITNNSNNGNYAAYHSANGVPYTGTAYEDLSVTEYIPANTTFVSATDGFRLDGNTLQWNVDIPAGHVAKLSYTVQITGEMGETIVSGGGNVAGLPTNTITNRIGGSKLTTDASQIDAFFTAGKNSWNSNEGYHISAAPAENTRFAERIYNEAFGKCLELPDVQALANIFFQDKVVSVDNGLYLFYNTGNITRYMYELTSAAPNTEDQVYHDMLVKDLYGGVWVWSDMHNGSSRTVELRESYLEVGDILVYMNLTEAANGGTVSKNRTVDSWRILVYLGDSHYASLTSDKRMEAVTGTAGLQAAFTYDMFVCLRPSQAYADINSAISAFDPANRPTLAEEDAASGYTSSASNVLLGALAASRLEALDAEDGSWIKVNGPFIGEVYNKIGTDIITNGTNDKSFADIMKTCFEDVAGTDIYNEYGHDYSLMEMPAEGAEKRYDMLMYYGGVCFATNKQRKLTDIGDLWPGDVIMMGRRQSSFYVTAIYQGNNKFLLNVQNRSSLTIDQKIWKNLYFASNDEFMAWLNSSVTDMAESLDDKNTFDPATAEQLVFENYIVLRPSRAFEDVNAIVSGLRDMTESALSATEKNILSQIQPSDYDSVTVGGANLDKVLPWLYKMAGINIAVGAYEPKTVNSLVGLIFDTSINPYGQTSSDTTDLAKYYQSIRLENCWGGVIDGAADRKIADIVSQLQIGDVVCGRYKGSKNYYYTALYQGDKFLVVHGNPSATCQIMTAAELDSIGLYYWYTLRLDQLAPSSGNDPVDPPVEPPVEPTEPTLRDMATGKLTDAEKAAISALTTERWKEECASRTLQKILPWAYQAAGVDVTLHSDYNGSLSVNSVSNLFANADTSAAGYAYFSKILVADSYGTSVVGIGTDDLQIGDIFCSAVTVNKVQSSGTLKLYYVAIYQGNGNFLAVYDVFNAENDGRVEGKSIMSVAELNAMEFTYRYLLRPEQLADSQVVEPSNPTEPTEPSDPSYRDITIGVLTDAEKAAFSALTAEQWAAECAAGNVDKILIWAYNSIGVDITAAEGYVAKTVHNIFNYLFELPSGATYYALRAEDSADTASVFYHKIQMSGIYGGTIFENNISLAENLSSLRIGDMFCARLRTVVDGSNQDRYWIGMYQGNGNFLTVHTTLEKIVLCDMISAAELDATAFQYYYLLRPEKLAADYTEPTIPDPTDPDPTDPTPTDPTPTDPAPTDPAPTDPAPTDPAPTDPAPTDPAPTDPTPADPTPADPTPADPVKPNVPIGGIIGLIVALLILSGIVLVVLKKRNS